MHTPPSRTRAIVAVALLAVLAGGTVQNIVTPLLPMMQRGLDVDLAIASWFVTTSVIFGAVVSPILSRAADIFGRRRLMIVALIVLATSLAAFAWSDSLAVLLITRAAQGVGLAITPLAIGVLRDNLAPKDAERASGFVGAALGIGGTLAVPLAGILADLAGWKSVFWVTAGLAVVGLVLVVLVVPSDPGETVASDRRFDIGGSLALSGALTAILFAVTQSTRYSVTSPVIWGPAVVGIILFVLFVIIERRVRVPLVRLEMITNRSLALVTAATFLIGYTFFATNVSAALLVQEPKSTGYGLGASAAVAGLAMLPTGVAMTVVAPLAARWATQFGPRNSVLLGVGLITAGYAYRVFYSTNLVEIITGVTIVGVGIGVTYAATAVMVLRLSTPAETSAAQGLNLTARLVGGTLATPVIAVILVSYTLDGSALPSLFAYQLVFLIAGIVSAVAGVLYLFVRVPAEH